MYRSQVYILSAAYIVRLPVQHWCDRGSQHSWYASGGAGTVQEAAFEPAHPRLTTVMAAYLEYDYILLHRHILQTERPMELTCIHEERITFLK